MKLTSLYVLFSCLIVFHSTASESQPSACDEISNRLASVKKAYCNDRMLKSSGSFSVEQRPILIKEYPPIEPKQPKARILLLGGIHGDELSSVSIIFKWMQILNKHHSGLFHWKVIPALNPDGLMKRKAHRTNEHGVDLNRNFPTENWQQNALINYWEKKTHKNPRRYPGPYPLSEPESQYLNETILAFQPDVIISVHAPFGLVDFDGPPKAPGKLGFLHLNLLGTYPGSLGNYAGVGMNVPVITIELPYAGIMPTERQVNRMWSDLIRWLIRNLPKASAPAYP